MEIDGSIGGGSVLRIVVPLAVAYGIPITVTNIRHHRRKPGLRLQHLLGLQLLQSISSAHALGLSVGSENIIFEPGTPSLQSHYNLRVGTAASLSLIIQTLQNYVAASSRSIAVQFHGGGTHVSWSPSAEYVQNITAPLLEHFGLTLNYIVDRIGFFPRGGAVASCTLSKSQISHPVHLTDFSSNKIHIFAVVSSQLRHRKVAERLLTSFPHATSQILYVDSAPGASLTAFSGNPTRGFSQVGEQRQSSESLSKFVASGLQQQLNIPALDEFASDQLLVPLAFAPSGSVIHVQDTDHVRTNLQVLDYFFTEVTGHEIFNISQRDKYLAISKI